MAEGREDRPLAGRATRVHEGRSPLEKGRDARGVPGPTRVQERRDGRH
jgi:hypothetical protein